jgi:hypothetical protein
MRYTAFTGSALVVIASSAAQAAESAAAGQKWWQMLLNFGLQIVLVIASIVLPVLIGALLRRYNIQVQSQQYTAAVTSAINAVEQIAASKLKAGQPPDSSAAKLAKAIEIANGLIKDFKLRELAAEKLTNLIEAKLGEKGKPAPAAATTPAGAGAPASDAGNTAAPQAVDAEDPK